jgi:hypothetical protein
MRFKTQFILINILLFTASLFFPVFEVVTLFSSSPKEVYMGYNVLMEGWYGLESYHVGWLANITWLISIILLIKTKYKWAKYLSIITVLLSIDGYFFPSPWFLGFYLWNAAMLTLPLIGLTRSRL